MFSWKVDRFTSNQDQNGHQIHFTSRNTSFCNICLFSVYHIHSSTVIWNAVESSYIVGLFTRVYGWVILRSKGQRSRSLEMTMWKSFFEHVLWTEKWMDSRKNPRREWSSTPRSILHMSLNTFRQHSPMRVFFNICLFLKIVFLRKAYNINGTSLPSILRGS